MILLIDLCAPYLQIHTQVAIYNRPRATGKSYRPQWRFKWHFAPPADNSLKKAYARSVGEEKLSAGDLPRHPSSQEIVKL